MEALKASLEQAGESKSKKASNGGRAKKSKAKA
jgi:hypothetical protein